MFSPSIHFIYALSLCFSVWSFMTYVCFHVHNRTNFCPSKSVLPPTLILGPSNRLEHILIFSLVQLGKSWLTFLILSYFDSKINISFYSLKFKWTYNIGPCYDFILRSLLCWHSISYVTLSRIVSLNYPCTLAIPTLTLLWKSNSFICLELW